MPISVTELLGDLAEVSIPIGAGEVKVKYYPGNYTPELEERFHNRIDEQHYSESLVTIVSGLTESWDLLKSDGSGETLAPSPEVLRTLPTTFLRKVMDGILADMRPNAASDENSDDT